MQLPNLLPMLAPMLVPQVKPAKRLAEQIREAYPDPKTTHDVASRSGVWSKENYCVLVAAQLFHNGTTDYCLKSINANLGATQAVDMQVEIASENDSGHFDAAWQLLDEALEAK